MTAAFGVKVLLEILIALLIVYGFIHEDELIEFETILKQYIKRRYRYANRKFKKSQK